MNSHRMGASGGIKNETEIKPGSKKRREETNALEITLGPWQWGMEGSRMKFLPSVWVELQSPHFTTAVKGAPIGWGN